MLKGPYTAIVTSVIIHILLLLTLVFGAAQTPAPLIQNKPKATAIKSFLYVAPKQKPQKIIEPLQAVHQPVITTQTIPKTPIPKKAPIEKTDKALDKPQTEKSKKVAAQSKTFVQNGSDTTNKNTAEKSNQAIGKKTFSSYDKLSRLRKKLRNQEQAQAFEQLIQQRSASIMDGDQFSVPKTIIPLTREQKYKKNTNTSHVGSITKNDNGTCTIRREQILGSPVHATTSIFACGESNFDKSFREHMKKVQEKLLIKR